MPRIPRMLINEEPTVYPIWFYGLNWSQHNSLRKYNMWGGQVKSENYVHNYKAFYGKLFNHKSDQYNYALNFRF